MCDPLCTDGVVVLMVDIWMSYNPSNKEKYPNLQDFVLLDTQTVQFRDSQKLLLTYNMFITVNDSYDCKLAPSLK